MSTAERILVVDDEPQIQRFLETSLGAHGYDVVQAMNGEEALRRAEGDDPDLIILDLGLPDIDGVDVLGTIRTKSAVPVIVLTVREQEVDKVGALDMGADDYVTKPFSVGELMARVRSCLRRNVLEQAEDAGYDYQGLSVDLDRRVVARDGRDIKLTPKEYDILRHLVQQAGKVVTHQTLLRDIWGPTYTSETHYLRVFVGQLRGKIEDDPAQPFFILTEPGVGYRLREPE